jgi:anti-sigma regulatory factor (Ser/Thr protein kinase)
MQPDLRAELSFPSDLKALRVLRGFVADVGGETPSGAIAPDALDGFILAVNEAASNVIRHGCAGHRDRTVWVEGEVLPDRLRVRLSHLGKLFSPTEEQVKPVEGPAEGGMGLSLMAQLADDVRYAEDGRGNVSVVLDKMYTVEHRRP